MQAAMYLRKSRAEENAPIADTLVRHREILTAFAKREKIIVHSVYEEVVSGDSLYARPQMLQLMEDLPKYEAVLCMDIDRLGRGAMHEQGLILDTFRRAGVLVVTPGKTYDLADDMDDSLISFKALFAREEYKMIRTRLRRGTMKAVGEGCYLSNAPFGYKQIRVDKKPTLEIVPEEAEGVRLIFRLYCEGQGCQQVADILHSLGYRPRRGQKFNRTTIAKIIRNPAYIGKVVWNQFAHDRPTAPGQKHTKRLKPREEWFIVDGLHPPIIDEETFDKANRQLSGKYHPPYRKAGEIKNPLSGVLFCSYCGKAITRQPLYNKPHCQPILLCGTAGCCMSTNMDIVEELFYQALKTSAGSLKADLPVSGFVAVPDIEQSAHAELSRLRQQLTRQHELLEQGVYDVDTFITRRDEINARIAETEKLLKTLGKKTTKQELIGRVENVLENYWEGTPSERNALIKSAVSKVIYNKPKGSGWGALPELQIVEWR
ncbi:MAG: recombinase family protein [Oscillospiraceae bacterium]|nr:recombinase family protein [Oscillospiraceae bacterium]